MAAMTPTELKDYLLAKMGQEDEKVIRKNIRWQRSHLRDLQLANHDGILQEAVNNAANTLRRMESMLGEPT